MEYSPPLPPLSQYRYNSHYQGRLGQDHLSKVHWKQQRRRAAHQRQWPRQQGQFIRFMSLVQSLLLRRDAIGWALIPHAPYAL